MSRTIIVANRLPVSITKKSGTLTYKQSIGGLATGLKSVHASENSLWLGWCGLDNEDLDEAAFTQIEKDLLKQHQCVPVFLSHREVDLFYNSFSNKTLWPLFHHFPMMTQYNHDDWQGYEAVNAVFFEKLKSIIKPDDRIWIHDYHLLLLPNLIKKAFPKIQIGLFLHIPFPSFEIFRLLPWRTEVLKGMLGADLIGFHTYDYTRHFLSSVQRILRYDAKLLTISLDQRECHVDVFPMGIDYHWYKNAFKRKSVQNQIRRYRKSLGDQRIILSVDRLDYTKGIPNRLAGYAKFLENHPEWKEKLTLVMIVAPSRTDVDTYINLKRELDEKVSIINSEHGTLGWTPINYFFRRFSSENLSALYGLADVLLVTPLRDGMNLIVKEYIACREGQEGVVIISETAGAASELGEALLVNANNVDEIADSLHQALTMDPEEQRQSITELNKRIEKNDAANWAASFLETLNLVSNEPVEMENKKLYGKETDKIINDYKEAVERLIFLDYDGTLVSFKSKPELAVPDEELLSTLRRLAEDERNELVIVSGRNKDDLDKWLGDIPCHLVAGHGVWIRRQGNDWNLIELIDNSWKEQIRPILSHFSYRTSGSFIEEKTYSLAWHYRKCDPDFAQTRLSEIKDTLLGITRNFNLGLQDGNKVLEIKDTHINKGRAISLWLNQTKADFICAIGDDLTDEDMFVILPESALTIKVGYGQTSARYVLPGVDDVRSLLRRW